MNGQFMRPIPRKPAANVQVCHAPVSRRSDRPVRAFQLEAGEAKDHPVDMRPLAGDQISFKTQG